MKSISRTPWLLPLIIVVGVICSPDNDQYSRRNQGLIRNTKHQDDYYRSARIAREPAALKDDNDDDDVKLLMIPDKWNFNRRSISSESQGNSGSYEIVFAANAKDDNLPYPNTRKKAKDLIAYEIGKGRQLKSDANDYSTSEREASSEWQIDNVRKRSSAEKSISEDGKRANAPESSDAVPLQELLRQWGIDTSVRGQRGDIEVTEAPRDYTGRGDVPAAFLHSRRYKREATGKKLLWRTYDNWDYGDNDGYQADQAHGDDYSDEEGRRHLKDHHRKLQHHQHNHHHHGHDNEERRRQQEEEETRRKEEEEENERKVQEEEEKEEEEERRRQDEERRSVDIERRRQEEERRRENIERRRHEEEERRRRPEAKGEVGPRGQEERVTSIPTTNPDEAMMTYEERVKQWHKMKELYDKQIRERHSGRNRNRTKTPEELENERKLQDYIRRNTPIDVSGRREHHNRTQPVTAPNQRRPEDSGDRRYHHHHSQAAAARNNEYEEQLRRREEEERRRQQQQQQRQEGEEERRRLAQVEADRRRYQQEEEERRRLVEEEQLRREQPPRGTEEEQRMRENEATRQAEQQRRLEQEYRRRLIEEQSRKYEEQHRKQYESRTNGTPVEQENDNRTMEQDRRRNEEGVKRPYQPVRMENRNDYYEASRSTTESYGDPSSRKRPTDETRKIWWTERPEILSTETEDSRRHENERRDWSSRPAEDSTGYPDRRRPDQKGWHEEENRRNYQEFKKSSDSVYRHGGRPALSYVDTVTVVTTPISTRRHDEMSNANDNDDDDDEDEHLRRLESVPIASRITPPPEAVITLPNDTQPPQTTSRLGGDSDSTIDFPGINSNRRGPEAMRFPVPVTSRPPVKSPKPCVWAIVVCCRDPHDYERQSRCFKAVDCLSWEQSRCRPDNVKAANRQIMNFYINSQANFL